MPWLKEESGVLRELADSLEADADEDEFDDVVDAALERDPGDADALRLVADRDHDPSKRLVALDAAISAGRARAGGDDAIGRARGSAWSVIACRPYLRARAARVETLIELSRFAEALSDGEALLDLDASDVMGVRFHLAAVYLMDGNPAAFRALAERHRADAARAVFAWGSVLAALLEGDESAARAARVRAGTLHGGVDRYLLEPWTLPPEDDSFDVGDDSERASAAYALYPAFAVHPTALGWLRESSYGIQPTSARMRDAIESLRPPGDDAPAPRWLAWLIVCGEEVPDVLHLAARLDGERAVRWLVALLESDALDAVEAVGRGHAPTSAAELLGQWGHPAALDALVRTLIRTDRDSARLTETSAAFRHLGAEAVEPLLGAYRSLPTGVDGDSQRVAFARPFGDLGANGVRDDRMFDALIEIFGIDPLFGGTALREYGDARAVQALRAALAGSEPDWVDRWSDSNVRYVHALPTIARLGGVWTPDERTTWDRLQATYGSLPEESDLHDEDEEDEEDDEADDDDDVIDGEFEDDADEIRLDGSAPAFTLPNEARAFALPVRPRSDVGRNDPCPCGSGKKYKKCCWDKDHRD